MKDIKSEILMPIMEDLMQAVRDAEEKLNRSAIACQTISRFDQTMALCKGRLEHAALTADARKELLEILRFMQTGETRYDQD
jgi:uncharacterized membrane protein YccC